MNDDDNQLPLCQGCGRELLVGELAHVAPIESNGEIIAISFICQTCVTTTFPTRQRLPDRVTSST